MYGEFFEGSVHFISQGLFNAKYQLENSECIIKVNNNTHVRCMNQLDLPFPEYFNILAPMDAVTVIRGTIPEDYLKDSSAEYYLRVRMKWDGF